MSFAPDCSVLLVTSEILLAYNHYVLCRFQGYSVIFLVDIKAAWIPPCSEITFGIFNLDSITLLRASLTWIHSLPELLSSNGTAQCCVKLLAWESFKFFPLCLSRDTSHYTVFQ